MYTLPCLEYEQYAWASRNNIKFCRLSHSNAISDNVKEYNKRPNTQTGNMLLTFGNMEKVSIMLLYYISRLNAMWVILNRYLK